MKTVAAIGHFDPVMGLHIKYLEEAIQLGDRLLVILSRDEQVHQMLGCVVSGYDDRRDVLAWGLAGRGEVVPNLDSGFAFQKSLAYYRPQVVYVPWWIGFDLFEGAVCGAENIEVVRAYRPVTHTPTSREERGESSRPFAKGD